MAKNSDEFFDKYEVKDASNIYWVKAWVVGNFAIYVFCEVDNKSENIK